MKRISVILLSLLLLASLLTACGRKDETAALSGQTFYMPENVAFTSGLQQVTGGCAVGDTVYLIGRVDNKGSGHLIQRLPLAGGEAETLPAYQSALPSGGFPGIRVPFRRGGPLRGFYGDLGAPASSRAR